MATIRSITLPVRSHPATQRIEQELYKLKSNDSNTLSSSAITDALSGLRDLHKCVQDLLGLPLTRQALAQHHQQKWIQQLVDDSLSYLDLCGTTRDILLAMRESVMELQSAIRRRRIRDSSTAYISLRRSMKKQIGMCLRKIDTKHGVVPLDLDAHLCAVVRVLREATLITSSVFRSLSLFLSTNVLKAKPRKWSLVSMMIHKGALGSCDDNEFESVDVALGELSSEIVEDDKIQSAQTKLEALESVIEGLETGLESLFRLFLHNRVCLLNVLSQ